MLIKTVTTVVTTDGAGKPVDAIPVRTAGANETDAAGRPVTPISVTEDPLGIPIRVVTGKAAQNSAGQWVDSIPVQGGGGGGGGGGAPAWQGLQVAGSRGEIPLAASAATTSANYRRSANRQERFGDRDISSFRIALPTWYVPGDFEADIPNAVNVNSYCIECNGVNVPVTFGGSLTTIIPTGGAEPYILSDPILPAAFGLTVFPASGTFWHRFEFSVAIGSVFYLQTSAALANKNAIELYYSGGAAAPVNTGGVGAIDPTGWTAITNASWGPLCILGTPVGKMMSIASIGDSILYGTADNLGDGINLFSGGWWKRATGSLTTGRTARMHMARGGQSAQNFNTATGFERRMKMIERQHVTHVYEHYGTNDLIQDVRTGPQCLADKQAIWARIKPYVYHLSVGYPHLVNTDGTLTAAWPGWVAFEAAIRAGIDAATSSGLVNAALDLQPTEWDRQTDHTLWDVANSSDGIHPSTGASAKLQVPATTFFNAINNAYRAS